MHRGKYIRSTETIAKQSTSAKIAMNRPGVKEKQRITNALPEVKAKRTTPKSFSQPMEVCWGWSNIYCGKGSGFH